MIFEANKTRKEVSFTLSEQASPTMMTWPKQHRLVGLWLLAVGSQPAQAFQTSSWRVQCDRRPPLRRLGLLDQHRGLPRLFAANEQVTATQSAGKDPTAPADGGDGGAKEFSGVKEALALFWDMSTPYFREEEAARWLLAGVVALTGRPGARGRD